MRKVLNNYAKSKRITGSSKSRSGTILNILDKNDNILCVGDELSYGEYRGVLLYNPDYGRNGQYGLALDYSMWYGEDKYDINSYGKFVPLPMDNGAKMEICKLERENK